MKNTMLIINPASGRGLSKVAIGTILSQLCENGHIVTVYFTGKLTAEELAFEHAGQYELVVCTGGDGSISSVISGVLRSGASIPIGYIPAGTANDIATTLSLSKTPAEAVKTIVGGAPKALDIGFFGEKYFTYIAAFGAFTGVAYSTPQSAKRSLGHLAYVLAGLAEMPAIKARHTVVEYDGSTISGDFVFGAVVNSTSVAGFLKLDPQRVNLADGMFEIVLVRQPLDPVAFLDLMASLAMQNYDGDNIQLLQASCVKFTFEEDVAWTVDGEDGGVHSEVEITNSHRAVSIIV
ncbi:MAG: YegS/Rv2252/BmrU family lipid kinase [Oscillospiraceae bacterium]|nr:YegS/Rv2252/BmrU family lipid kinase [Oscillospiraceae bacterium]